MGHISPASPLLPPLFCQGPLKPRTDPLAGYRKPELQPNGLGGEDGPDGRPPKKPRVGGGLWIVGVLALATMLVAAALLLLAFSHGRELESQEKSALSAQKENLPHKP